MTTPITPSRAKEIKRAAARHAAGMLMVSLSEWEPQKYNPESARDDAEEALVREEIERIADEIRLRAIVGTSQPCAECGIPYRIKTDGTLHHHNGVAPNGYSSGDPCPGVGKPPRNRTA
ncbi:MAG: hypothetical protein HOV70_31690 [Streptomyces sp.]|nr:hypothetical protein [Streptomyces sp.]